MVHTYATITVPWIVMMVIELLLRLDGFPRDCSATGIQILSTPLSCHYSFPGCSHEGHGVFLRLNGSPSIARCLEFCKDICQQFEEGGQVKDHASN